MGGEDDFWNVTCLEKKTIVLLILVVDHKAILPNQVNVFSRCP